MHFTNPWLLLVIIVVVVVVINQTFSCSTILEKKYLGHISDNLWPEIVHCLQDKIKHKP